MIDLKNILLTTDISENANAAAPYAAELARQFKGRIQLVHVFENFLYFPVAPELGGYAVDAERMMEAARIERKKQLEQLAKTLADREHVDVTPVLLDGHPATQIVK